MKSVRRVSQMIAVAAICAVGASAALAEDEIKPASPMMPLVKMETTVGDIYIELNGEKAPISTLNFIDYTEAGYYDGTVFHRIIKGFMIQGGGMNAAMDAKNEGLRGGIKNEWRNGLKNVKYSIAMARTSDPDSGTSQFFINHADNDFLDKPNPPGPRGAAYAVFGKVAKGEDVVEKIAAANVVSHPKYPSPQPVTPDPMIEIKKVTVVGQYDRAKITEQAGKADELQRKAEAEAAAKGAKELEAKIATLEAKHKTTFKTLPSGLRIATLKAGEGANPKPTENVTVHYKGELVDGTEFDSSYKRNAPATFPLNRVIAAWTEGVGLMQPGGKSILICPPDIAYGAAGRPPVIPPNATLIFEVELISIEK